jgi:hypothetical protein
MRYSGLFESESTAHAVGELHEALGPTSAILARMDIDPEELLTTDTALFWLAIATRPAAI